MSGKMKATTALTACIAALAMPALTEEVSDSQTVAVGQWTIATTYEADTFENCTMTRSVDDLIVRFLRNREGVLVSLESSKWMLEGGESYPVQLAVGPAEVDTQATAASKSVTIPLSDTELAERLRTGDVLEVRGEGMTLSVPLDGSAAGLERLDECFEKNLRQSPESNPFVAPAKRP